MVRQPQIWCVQSENKAFPTIHVAAYCDGWQRPPPPFTMVLKDPTFLPGLVQELSLEAEEATEASLRL